MSSISRYLLKLLLLCTVTIVFPSAQSMGGTEFVVSELPSSWSIQQAETRPLTKLEPGKPIERTIKGGEAHIYTIALLAKQFLRVTVDQRGVDVVVNLYAPDGKLLEERDRPNGAYGEESLAAEVSVEGTYKLEVKTFTVLAKSGEYEIRIDVLRFATKQDKQRITAEKIFQEATNLRSKGTRESSAEAATKCQESLPIWREVRDRYAEGLTLHTLSGINAGLGHAEKAIALETEALTIFRALTNREAESSSLLYLAIVWRNKSDFEQAARCYEELASVRRAVRDEAGEVDALKETAEMLSSLAATHQRKGEPFRAIENYQRAIVFSQTAGDKSAEADALDLIGRAYYGTGDKAKALDYYNKALALFKEVKDIAGVTRTERDTSLISPREKSRKNNPQRPFKAQLVVQTGHAQVNTISFSQDGKILASGSDDRTIKIWDVESGKELRTLSGHSQAVTSVAIGSHGKILASGSEDTKIKLWNVESGEQLNTLSGHSGRIRSVAFSPDEKLLASGSDDKTIKIWDVDSGKELRTLHSSYVKSVAFTPDGNNLVSVSDSIRISDVESGKELRTLSAYCDDAFSVAVSSDLRFVACGASRGGVQLWDVEHRKEPRTLLTGASLVASVAFSPDSKTLVSQNSDNTVKLWDVLSGKELPTLLGEAHLLGHVVFSPDGKTVAGSDHGNNIELWDLESRRVRTFGGPSDSFYSVSISPDGKFLAAGSFDNTIRLWNLETGTVLRTLTEPPRNLAPIFTVRFRNGEVDLSASEHSCYVVSLAFSPDGRTLASGNADEGNTIKLWNVQTGKVVRTLEKNSWFATSLSFSSDGSALASRGPDRITKLWDVQTGKLVKSFNEEDANAKQEVERLFPTFYRQHWKSAVSEDYAVTVASESTLNLFDRATRKRLAILTTVGENDWAVIDAENRFDCSEQARKFMQFVIGLEPIDFEQLKDRYYEPGLLQKIIKHQPLRLANVRPFTGEELYPSVEYEPLKQGQKSFSVHLKNRGGGIGAVQVRLNGVEKISDARPPGFDTHQKEAILTIDLSKVAFISGGENKLEVVAFNAAGWLRSRGTQTVYTAEGERNTDAPELYAVIGGVSHYADDGLDLRYSAKDADDFARALELGAMKVFGTDKVHIRLLSSGTDQKEPVLKGADSKQLAPTRKNFQTAFAEFRKAKPNDIFLLYLSGHGTSIKLAGDTGDTYLYLTQDAVTTDSARLLDEALRSDTTISSVELTQWTGNIRAGKKAMILDTCAAGAAENSLIARKDITTEQTYQILALDRLKYKAGFYVLMGSAANAQSYEATRYGQGLLTYSLLNAMKGAGLKNEYAFIEEMFGYAVKNVPDLAQGNGLIQQPRMFTPEQSEDFFVGRFTQEEQKQFTLASPKPMILNPTFLNATLLRDNLNLSSLLRLAFHNASAATARDQARIAFVEADEMYGGIKPSGVYETNGDTITLKIVLSKGTDSIGDPITITGSTKDEEALVKQIVDAVSAAAQMIEMGGKQ